MPEITIDFEKGDVVAIHIGQFFGTQDLRVRFTSKARLTIQTDTDPIDLLANTISGKP